MKKMLNRIKNLLSKYYLGIIVGANKAFDRAENDFGENRKAVLFLGALCLVGFFSMGFEETILLITFLAFFIFRWDIRIISFLSLFSLVGSCMLSLFDLEGNAKKLAVFAFYFFLMGIILHIREMVSEKESFSVKIFQSRKVDYQWNLELNVRSWNWKSYLAPGKDLARKVYGNIAKSRFLQLAIFQREKRDRILEIREPADSSWRSYFDETELSPRKKEVINIFVNQVIIAGIEIISREKGLRKKDGRIF